MKNSETTSEMKRLHELGLHFHWLHIRKKRPIEAAWTETSRKTLKGLMAQHRNGMNLGIRTGKAGDVYYGVIDVDVKSTDPKHREEVYEILGSFFPQLRVKGSPYTMSGRGNRSRHYHIKSLATIPKRKVTKSTDAVEVMIDGKLQSRPAWEIEILGGKSNVVMPPSV